MPAQRGPVGRTQQALRQLHEQHIGRAALARGAAWAQAIVQQHAQRVRAVRGAQPQRLVAQGFVGAALVAGRCADDRVELRPRQLAAVAEALGRGARVRLQGGLLVPQSPYPGRTQPAGLCAQQRVHEGAAVVDDGEDVADRARLSPLLRRRPCGQGSGGIGVRQPEARHRAQPRWLQRLRVLEAPQQRVLFVCRRAHQVFQHLQPAGGDLGGGDGQVVGCVQLRCVDAAVLAQLLQQGSQLLAPRPGGAVSPFDVHRVPAARGVVVGVLVGPGDPKARVQFRPRHGRPPASIRPRRRRRPP